MSRSPKPAYSTRPTITAILVDGAFYQKQAKQLFGKKSPKDRAEELFQYCMRHIRAVDNTHLYRIFYYDCPPSDRVFYHPLTKKNINLGKSELFKWATDFHKELKKKRKLAFRKGEVLESQNGYMLKKEALKQICSGKMKVEELTENDFYLDITQKGVDMRLGIDIASLANKGAVNQIVLIAGDSDFVPAAKYARREGIDFVLDPMWHPISDSLYEHIDGLKECVNKPPENLKDPLCVIKDEAEDNEEKQA